MKELCVALVAAVLAAPGLVGGTSPPPPWTVPAGYIVEVFASDLQLPVNIAFVPDPGTAADSPFFYVTELRGTIKVVTRSGVVSDYATDLLDYVPPENFPGPGEQGLTGVVVDPTNGDVYATMLRHAPPSFQNPKVVRFTSVDGGRTAATQTTILDMDGEEQGQSHQISTISFGPDDLLYVHNGDGFSTFTAQDLDYFRGKILRLNRDGTAPTDNPFYTAGDGDSARDYVYAYGVRNPFGGAWRASENVLYEVENGPHVDRFARIVPGMNLLWDGSDASMTQHALYNWVPATGPVNLVFLQRETLGGSGFPAEKMGHAFVSESGPTYASGPQLDGKRITEFALDAAGALLDGPDALIAYNGSGKNTVVALAAGPDGLYFSDFYRDVATGSPIRRGARVLRIRSLSVPRLPLTLDRDELAWASLTGVTDYDVIRGDLGALRTTGGDFAQAGVTCRIDDTNGSRLTETAEPDPGAGFWYLVRDMNASGFGSYESGGVGQRGLRDPEIASALNACP